MYYLYEHSGRLLASLIFNPEPESADDPRIALQVEANGAAGAVFFDGDEGSHYVSNGEVLPRPQNGAYLDGMTLRGLPVPCTISINGVDYECTDTDAELSFDQPGEYVVLVRAFPALDKEFTVENPAS